jgi:exodeoxyribonuclease VII small subunit
MTIGDRPEANANEEELPFEEILARLQRVVGSLEQGDLPLEQSLAVFEEGVRLSRLGTRRLDDAERRVEILLAEDGRVARTRPFEADPKGDSPAGVAAKPPGTPGA